MKNTIAALGLLLSASYSQAQISSGNALVGGTVGYNSSKAGDAKTTVFNFSPNLGYFFINNLAGGLRVDLQNSATDLGMLEVESSSTLVSPFLRYYVLPAAKKLNVFADVSAGFGSTKFEGVKNSSTALGVAAGPVFFITRNAALEFQVGYTSIKTKDVEERTANMGVGLGLQIHLGK